MEMKTVAKRGIGWLGVGLLAAWIALAPARPAQAQVVVYHPYAYYHPYVYRPYVAPAYVYRPYVYHPVVVYHPYVYRPVVRVW